jgi:hypothetical protein
MTTTTGRGQRRERGDETTTIDANTRPRRHSSPGCFSFLSLGPPAINPTGLASDTHVVTHAIAYLQSHNVYTVDVFMSFLIFDKFWQFFCGPWKILASFLWALANFAAAWQIFA